jgi:hypothetical protein
MRSLYFPAVSAALSSYLQKDDSEIWNDPFVKNIGNVPFRFYNSDSVIGKHPYILFSAAHHYKIKDMRKAIKAESDVTIFADSGGFQLATGVVSEDKFNDEIAYDWCEQNADIFPILDRPILDYKKFEYHVSKTEESAKYYYNRFIKTDKSKKILNVMSGGDINYIDEWFERVIEPYPLGHFAHGKHQANFRTIMQVYFYLYNKKQFQQFDHTCLYHILGVSTPKLITYISYFQMLIDKHHHNVQLTFDSSTPFRQIAFGIMMMDPRIESFMSYRLSNTYRYDFNELALPCTCSICKNITDPVAFLEFYNKKYKDMDRKSKPSPKEFYITLSLHNLKLMLDWKTKMDIMINNNWTNSLMSYLRKEEIDNFKLMRRCFENPQLAQALLASDAFKWKDAAVNRQNSLFPEDDDDPKAVNVTLSSDNFTEELTETGLSLNEFLGLDDHSE